MTDLDLDICDLATTRSFDLSQYSITITIEKSNTQQPFRFDRVPQLVLQSHDIDMIMLGATFAPKPSHCSN